MLIERSIHCTSLVLVLLLILLSPSQNSCQILKNKGGRIEYHDSSVVIGQDTIKIVYGSNLDMGLRFWSKDLRDRLEYSRRFDPGAIDNLYEISLYQAYLGAIPDTSRWLSFSSSKLGISFHYPRGLEVRVRYDSSGSVVELGEGTKGKLVHEGPPSFTVLVQMTFTSNSFPEEARLHGWQFKNGLFYLAEKGGDTDFDVDDIAYIEGNQWKCIHGDESFRFQDENNIWGTGDSLKFLAMVDRTRQPSLLVEFYDAVDHNVPLFEEDVFMVLSSVQLAK